MPLPLEGPAVVLLAETGKETDVPDKLVEEVGRLEPPDAGKDVAPDVGVYSLVEEPPVGIGTLEPVGPTLGPGLEELVNGKGSDVASEVELLDSLLGGTVAAPVLEFEKDELSGPILMLMEISGLGEVNDVVPPDVGLAVSEAESADVVDTTEVVLSKDVESEILEDWLLWPEEDAGEIVVEFNVGDAERLSDIDADEPDDDGAEEL